MNFLNQEDKKELKLLFEILSKLKVFLDFLSFKNDGSLIYFLVKYGVSTTKIFVFHGGDDYSVYFFAG